MKKSKFKLSHIHSATLDAGYLVPFLLQPTLPNDSFRIGLSTFLRAQPMLAPLMHEVYLNTQYWYVPYRLLWDKWEDFITGGSNLDTTPVFPTVTSTTDDAKVGSLWDYFGFPLETGVEVSAMPFRALAEIWNTRYRDEDLQSEIPISYISGNDTTTSRKLLSPCIAKDYFSISRPYTQRGADIFVPVTSGESSRQIYHRHSLNVFYVVLGRSATYFDRYFSNAVITRYRKVGSNPASPEELISYADNKELFSRIITLALGSANRTYLSQNLVAQVSAPSSAQLESYFDKTSPGITNDFFYTPTISSTTVEGIRAGELVMLFESSSQTLYTIKGFNSLVTITIVSDETVPTAGVNVTPFAEVKQLPFDNGTNLYGTINGSVAKALKYTWYVTLNSTGAVSIRDLRESSALQRYAERSLKYGNRYEEFIQREFGISPRDSRIQRPEYIGGGRGLLNISEVLQTAESTDTGVGTMRGHGIGSISQRRIKFRSPEHGLIIGLLSIRPKTVYTQGIDREFLKRSRLDFFTPELANIGMQEVLTQEIYANNSNKGSIFGYSDRYQEYRYHKPLVTGEFRGNLNFWNMALEFANQPELNGEFVDMATYAENWKRPFQIQDNSAHAFVCMLKNHIRAYRPIPKRAKDILK